MTLYEFIALNERDRANAVWEGKFIGLREEEKYSILLYRVYDFYCEVFYDKVDNSILRIRPFKTKKLLEPYFSYRLN
jgi:phosphoenolpyruvate synthase/pyruvate phosphate dikinase